MWRSGKFIEVETIEFHPGTVARAIELIGKDIGMFKERHETKITLSDEELKGAFALAGAAGGAGGVAISCDEGKPDA